MIPSLFRNFKGNNFIQKRSSHSFNTAHKIGPAAKILLLKHNINDISAIKPTGPRNTILNTDVLNFISNIDKQPNKVKATEKVSFEPLSLPPKASAQAVSTFAYTDEPNSQVRKVIAKRLTESKYSIPHYYVSADCVIDNLLAMRKEYNEQFNTKISVNDFIVKAVGAAFHRARNFHPNDSVDVSVAVASERGLITPIVRSANSKQIHEISAEVKSLSERAKLGKLAPEEFQGGHITISNLGMFGISSFSAIINPPQGIIVAVGAGEQKVIAKEDSDGNFVPSVGTVMTITLSVDNRSISEEEAGKFLDLLKSNLTHPETILLYS